MAFQYTPSPFMLPTSHYDKKKAEYLEQYGDPYGIFDDEPTEKNRPSVEKFITLPKDYEDGDEQ